MHKIRCRDRCGNLRFTEVIQIQISCAVIAMRGTKTGMLSSYSGTFFIDIIEFWQYLYKPTGIMFTDFARRLLQDGLTPRQGNKTDQAHPPIHPVKSALNLEVGRPAFLLIMTVNGHFLKTCHILFCFFH